MHAECFILVVSFFNSRDSFTQFVVNFLGVDYIKNIVVKRYKLSTLYNGMCVCMCVKA